MIRKKQVHSCAQSCIYSGFLKGQLHWRGWLECFCSSCVVQLTICRWHHPNGRKWRGAKESLDEGERGEWKSRLKTQHSKNEYQGIWSHHFMANRRGNSGNRDRHYFPGLQITADGDCNHEIKRYLFPRIKAMTDLDSILKSRDITLPTKVHLVKAVVFPVVMYGCESWTIKKAERQRIDVFELWCWRRLLRVPWTARRSNQSILKR